MTHEQQIAIKIAKQNPLVDWPHLILMITVVLGASFAYAEMVAKSPEAYAVTQR